MGHNHGNVNGLKKAGDMYYVNVVSEFQDKTTNLYIVYRIYLIKHRIIKFLVFPMLPLFQQQL